MSPPPTSKKSYTALSGSESSNDSHDTKQEGVNDRDGEKTKFKWRGLKGQSKGSHSPIIEGQEKGHSRSTSLDLNKMLLGEGNTEG